MPVTELNHYFVRANDLERSKRFYCEVLGFEVMPRPDFPFPGYWLGTGGRIQVHMGPHGIPGAERYFVGTRPGAATDNSGVVDHIAFLATDPRAFAERFATLGIRSRNRYLADARLFQVFVEDPDGLTVELNFHGVDDTSLWSSGAEDYAAMPDARSATAARSGRPAHEMRIAIDDPARADVLALLDEHLRNMRELSPPESVHALDVSRLKVPAVTFWTVRDAGGALLGCGALKELDAGHGEIKSMRTPQARRRSGAGRAMLEHIVREARRRGYRRLSLETGSADAFVPAQTLYASAGFVRCGPFADYGPDPNSVFMSLALGAGAA